MHALLSHGEKPRPELGSQCGPGGRKREEGAGRTPRSYQRRGREGQKANHSNPPNRCISLCKMGTAIVLPLCWGKKNTRTTEGYSQGRRDTWMALPPLAPFPVFYSRWGKSSQPVSVPIALRSPGDVLALHRGSRGDPGRGIASLTSSSSSASTTATGPPRQHLTRFPVACFPARSTG